MESMKLNQNFQRGEVQTKKTFCVGYGYFLEEHIMVIKLK